MRILFGWWVNPKNKFDRIDTHKDRLCQLQLVMKSNVRLHGNYCSDEDNQRSVRPPGCARDGVAACGVSSNTRQASVNYEMPRTD